MNNPLKYIDPSGYQWGDYDTIEIYPVEGGYQVYNSYLDMWVFTTSLDWVGYWYSDTDIYYWDSDDDTLVYAYYDSDDDMWYGAEYAHYDSDDGWSYSNEWTEFYISADIDYDWKSWGALMPITNPENFLDPRPGIDWYEVRESMASGLNVAANVVEFISPGIAAIPPEFMLAAAGIACIPGAALPVVVVAGVYIGVSYGPDILRTVANWIDPD